MASVGAAMRRSRSTAEQEAGTPGLPYLRHDHPLLIAEGRNPFHVAQQLGDSPTMTLDTYGHVIEELAGNKRVSAAEEILKARSSVAEKLRKPDSSRSK
jgi:hypothetical protein